LQPFVECWFTKIDISDFDNIAKTSNSFAQFKTDFISKNGDYISFVKNDTTFNACRDWIEEFEKYVDNM